MNEELKEYIIAKRTPISSCVGLSKYFIGRHRTSPVYLTLQFEREFNSKMCELEKLKEQLEKERKVRRKAIEFMKNCEFDKTDKYIAIGEYQEYKELLEILDIDKGE